MNRSKSRGDWTSRIGWRSTAVRVLEQLEQLETLRSLTVGQGLPDDSSITLLTRIPKLQTLYLAEVRISDAGLIQLAVLKSLRVLSINLPKVSRKGIASLREARPDVQVIVTGDMRRRLGPAEHGES